MFILAVLNSFFTFFAFFKKKNKNTTFAELFYLMEILTDNTTLFFLLPQGRYTLNIEYQLFRPQRLSFVSC